MSLLEAPDPAPREHRPRPETASFEEFYEQCWPRLVRCLIAQAGDSRWAEDIAQDTMLDARGKWDQLLTYDRPDLWLLKVAIRRLRRMEGKGREGICSPRTMAPSPPILPPQRLMTPGLIIIWT